MVHVVHVSPAALAFEPLGDEPFAPFVPECRRWLHERCGPNITHTELLAGRDGWAVLGYKDFGYRNDSVSFVFALMETAIMFKLTWGGIR